MASVNGTRVGANRLVEVSVDTLDNIINENLQNKVINLLSLDTEGYEFEILKGLNLDKNRPQYMLIEIYVNDFVNISNYLAINNYSLHSCFSNYNKKDNPGWDMTHNDFLFYDNLQIKI
jgi:hypothetical protein